ncbi:hypothetical protein KBI51_05085 [Aerococcaceae bacterium zg-ZUI334]|uniref:hypothetical protein n=1 Tax=Aerococcaceae bacterium zg-252 TaxID=2796928 RepID=UPI001BA35D46|nr:hypothetical protein [Aerococcaceae bacterium zg-ZUI334]
MKYLLILLFVMPLVNIVNQTERDIAFFSERFLLDTETLYPEPFNDRFLLSEEEIVEPYYQSLD